MVGLMEAWTGLEGLDGREFCLSKCLGVSLVSKLSTHERVSGRLKKKKKKMVVAYDVKFSRGKFT